MNEECKFLQLHKSEKNDEYCVKMSITYIAALLWAKT